MVVIQKVVYVVIGTMWFNIVIIDHFWVVRNVTVTLPFLTTLRAKLGPEVVALTTQKLSLGCHCDGAFLQLFGCQC